MNPDNWPDAFDGTRIMRVERPSPLERRWHSRVGLRLPAYQVDACGGPEAIGLTLNISRSGALIQWQSAIQPQLHESMQLDLELPAEGGTARMLSCKGRVVRIEGDERGTLKVAFSITCMKFRARPPKAPQAATRGGCRQKRAGHSVVEVALLSPWLFFLFVGILDFGFYSYALICTQNAARAAALYTSSKEAAVGHSAHACEIALGEMRALPNVRTVTVPCCATVTPACPLSVTAQEVVGPDAQRASQVRVSYLTVPMVPIPGVLSGRLNMTRTVEMRLRTE